MLAIVYVATYTLAIAIDITALYSVATYLYAG